MIVVVEEFPDPKRIARRRNGRFDTVHMTDSLLRPSPDYIWCPATEQWFDRVVGHARCQCGQPHTTAGPDIKTLCGIRDEGGLEFVPIAPWDEISKTCAKCEQAAEGTQRAKRFL